MPDPLDARTDSPLLRGLFGVLQAGAAAHADTASIWSDLRQTAGSWQFRAQGLPEPYDPAALESAGREILRAQGIDGATVSSFRGVAGQWLGAKQSLASRDPAGQILASDIFTPPWAKTSSAAVPSRYRVRTLWQVEPAAGDIFTRWRTTELEGPISSLLAAIDQASPTADTTSGREILASTGGPTLLDYEIEQI